MRNGGKIGTLNIPRPSGSSGIYTLDEAQEFVKIGIWPGFPQDPNFASVILCTHFTTQLADPVSYPNSGSGHALNGAGTSPATSLVTEQSKWYTTSFKVNASYVRQNAVDYTFGTADFTVEMWVYPSSVSASQDLVDFRGAEPQVTPLMFIQSPGVLVYWVNGAAKITSANNTASINAWHFFSVSRVSGNTRMYWDGVQAGSTYVDANNYIGTGITLGAGFGGTSPLSLSYIGEIRVTQGVGRYSGATHTVPTAPFPDS